MVKTRYRPFILRLRLDDPHSHKTDADQVVGSVHQVGLQEIIYFDTAQKFQEVMHELVAHINAEEMKYGDQD
jgi:hypothetical protein